MRFARDALVLTLIVAFAGGGPLASEPRPASGTAVSPEEVRAAAAKLRLDPDLGGEHKVRTLHWTRSRAAGPPQKPPPPWIQGLFEYFGQAGSLLVWAAGITMAAIALLWTYRTLKARTPAPALIPAPSITRVGSMDIRPESLPGDIGQAALALTERGMTREAISLLYRGALSRAIHQYGVPIGESYTEGEALRAVGTLLEPSRVSYFSDLVGMRQRIVYAGEPMAAASIRHLCRRFALALDAPR